MVDSPAPFYSPCEPKGIALFSTTDLIYKIAKKFPEDEKYLVTSDLSCSLRMTNRIFFDFLPLHQLCRDDKVKGRVGSISAFQDDRVMVLTFLSVTSAFLSDAR